MPSACCIDIRTGHDGTKKFVIQSYRIVEVLHLRIYYKIKFTRIFWPGWPHSIPARTVENSERSRNSGLQFGQPFLPPLGIIFQNIIKQVLGTITKSIFYDVSNLHRDVSQLNRVSTPQYRPSWIRNSVCRIPTKIKLYKN